MLKILWWMIKVTLELHKSLTLSHIIQIKSFNVNKIAWQKTYQWAKHKICVHKQGQDNKVLIAETIQSLFSSKTHEWFSFTHLWI